MNDTVTPLISVVIPTYNHARFLGRALQSVLNQTYPNWEAIVIDNHSTDSTDKIMASFADQRITYLKIHNNGVIATSRNAGIRVAKGEWIAFLDSDDWWSLDKLQVCFDSINDNVDLVYHDMEIVSEKPLLFRRKMTKSWQVKKPVLVDLLTKGNAIVNSSVVVRKCLLEKIGGICDDVKMISAEDYNTWLCISLLSDGFKYLAVRLGYYLQHGQNISGTDKSLFVRHAVAELIPLLDRKDKIKHEVIMRYAKGRFNYVAGQYVEAKNELLFCLRYGDQFIRLKSMLMLIRILR